MNERQIILKLARRSLMVLAAAIAIALALYLGSRYFKDRMQMQLVQVQQIETSNQASLAEKQADLASLQAEIIHFNLLRQQGMVGVPDRAGWVEQLTASRQRTGMPDTLAYTLQAPKPLSLQNGTNPTAEPADAATAEGDGAMFHDLNIEFSSIHEAELLAFLHDYQTHVKGLFRVDGCTLSMRTETGLSARCTLRFFTLPDARPSPDR